MNVILIILGIIIFAVLILLNVKLVFTKEDKRKKYLQSLGEFLETKVEPLEGLENSYHLRFAYQGTQFSYEDIEDRLKNSCVYKVYLKAMTASKFKIDFTEKERTTIRANVQNLNDIKTPWARDAEKILLPHELQDFTVFSNDNKKANKLFAKERIAKIFTRFKNMTNLGHPYQSLAVMDGMVILTFHPPGGLKPGWGDFQDNASRIEEYLEELNVLVAAINALEER